MVPKGKTVMRPLSETVLAVLSDARLSRGGTSQPLPVDDPEVAELLEEFHAALAAGEKPDRSGLLARFPEIAHELNECLDGLEFLNQAVSAVVSTSVETDTLSPSELGRLGDFQLVCEIGRGGMGVVYEALQLSLGRRVALKVLPFAAVLDPRQLQRFKNEAQAAALLKHPHIVSVYSIGCERSVHYYAMELIDGQSVAQLIRQLAADRRRNAAAVAGDSTPTPTSGRWSSEYQNRRSEYHRGVARLGVQAAEALEYAHQMGVVHRDIKPSNQLLDAEGHLWITDFGLATTKHGSQLTRTGDLLGTLRVHEPRTSGGSASGSGPPYGYLLAGSDALRTADPEARFPRP